MVSRAFDFRGHGESGAKPEQVTITGEVKDLAAAVSFLRRRRVSRFGIVGTSLGAGVAVLYAAQARRPPFAMALLSPVLDYRRTFLEPETAWGKKWFNPSALTEAYEKGTMDIGGFSLGIELIREFETVSPAKFLRGLTIPILIVHSEGDPITPFHTSRDVARSSPGVKFVRVRGEGHYFEGFQTRIFQKISQWLKTQLPA